MGPRFRGDDTGAKPTLRRPCYLRRGRAVVSMAPPEMFEGARDAGARRTHGPVCERKKAHRQIVTASPPKHPASRARCLRLALRQPRRTDALAGAANLLSSAGDPRPVSRIIAAWASAARVCVLHPVAATAPRPRPHDARDVPRRGRDNVSIVLLGLKSRKELPSVSVISPEGGSHNAVSADLTPNVTTVENRSSVLNDVRHL